VRKRERDRENLRIKKYRSGDLYESGVRKMDRDTQRE
jgi:hypothetical protein